MIRALRPPPDIRVLLPTIVVNDHSIVLANEERLTPREYEVLLALRSGSSYRVMASALGVAESTVAHAVRRVREKTGSSTIRLALLSEFLADTNLSDEAEVSNDYD